VSSATAFSAFGCQKLDVGHADSSRKLGLCGIPRHERSPRAFGHDQVKQIGSADGITRLRVPGAPGGSLCHGRNQATIKVLGLDKHPLPEESKQKLQSSSSVGLVFDAADTVLDFEGKEPVPHEGLLGIEQF